MSRTAVWVAGSCVAGIIVPGLGDAWLRCCYVGFLLLCDVNQGGEGCAHCFDEQIAMPGI